MLFDPLYNDGMNALERVTLRSKTPCCGRPVRFAALVDLPREAYERRCRCGRRWWIDRLVLRVRPGIRIDSLEWTWR